MGSGIGTAEQPVEITPQAEPPRSLAERALRWLIGADRREAEAQAQAQAAQAQAAALARAEAEAAAQVERDRLAAQEQAERMAADAREAQAASVDAAATTTEPLIHVATPTGGSYYVRTPDWLAARAAGKGNVPVVDWQGEPVPVQAKPGKDTPPTLRVSTIEKSVLRPTAILTAAAYLDPEQSQDGPSLSM